MMRTLAIALLAISYATLPAVAEHDHPPVPDDPVPYPSAVRYSIRAEAMPDSLLIRGLADVVVENRTDSALKEIRFLSEHPLLLAYLPPPGSPDFRGLVEAVYAFSETNCVIDSILYQGVPVRSKDLTIGHHEMSVLLETPIPPGQSGFFLISFGTRLNDISGSPRIVVLDGWFPSVTTQGGSTMTAVTARCDIDLWLQVDSSYDLAAPGELMNNRELYGLLPEAVEDSVYVDVVSRYQPEQYGRKFEPVYESGRKAFYIRHHNATGMPLIFGAGLKRDRTKAGSTTVEHVYPGGRCRQVPGFVCGRAADLIQLYSDWLGPLPHKNVNIISGLDPDVTIDPSMIVLPRRDLDDDAMTGLMAVQLAQLWLPPIMPESATASAVGYTEGIAAYIAMRGLGQIYGPASGAMISKAIDGLRHEHDDALFNERLKTIPIDLYMARWAMGDSLFLSVLSKYSSHYRHSYAPEDGLIEASRTELDPDDVAMQRLLRFEAVTFDYALVGVASGEHDVEYTLANRGDIRLPVEIAFVGTNGDTLFDTLAVPKLPQAGEEVACRQSLPFDLRAIMLDPHYLLFDKDRRDNVFLIGRSRDRSHPPEELFPAYHRTKQPKDQ